MLILTDTSSLQAWCREGRSLSAYCQTHYAARASLAESCFFIKRKHVTLPPQVYRRTPYKPELEEEETTGSEQVLHAHHLVVYNATCDSDRVVRDCFVVVVVFSILIAFRGLLVHRGKGSLLHHRARKFEGIL